MATTIAHGALMQAAFFLGPNQMELREAPVPVPGLGEVLLRVNACAVCGTDLRILGGGKTRGVYRRAYLDTRLRRISSRSAKARRQRLVCLSANGWSFRRGSRAAPVASA